MLLLWVALPFVIGQTFFHSPTDPEVYPPALHSQSQPLTNQQINFAPQRSFGSPQQVDYLPNQVRSSRRTEGGPPKTIQLARQVQRGTPNEQQQPVAFESGKARFGGDVSSEVSSFHLNIGTVPGGRDVVDDDNPTSSFSPARSDAPNSDSPNKLFTVSSNTVFTTFYVSRLEHADYDNARLLAQRVNVVVEGRDASARLGQTWTMIEEVPSIRNTTSPLTFTVQYECFNAGKPQVQVKIRLFRLTTNKDKQTQRTIKEITFEYVKECEKASGTRGSGNANPGFHIGLTPNGTEVIEDGIAKTQFSLGVGADAVYTVPADVDKLDLWIRGPNIVINTPFIYVRNQQVLQAQGIGLDDAQPLVPDWSYSYSIKFLCSSEGESKLTVVLSAKTTSFRRTFFTLKKICAAATSEQVPAAGAVVQGFSVSAEWNGHKFDVISDGKVRHQFKPSVNPEAENRLERPLVPRDVDNVTFVVELREPNLKLKVPWVQSFPFQTDERINKPRVNTDRKQFRRSSQQQPGVFSILFNCKGVGKSNNVISLRVSGEEVSFVVRKVCGETDVTTEDDKQEPPLYKITGLNIGTHKFGTDVVKDGIPAKKYDWDTPWQKAQLIGVSESFFTLFIWRNKTADPRPMRLDTPELSSTLEICEPQIAGPGSDGDVLDATHPTSFISINFHCMKPGTTHFNLVIPFSAYEEQSSETQGRRLLAEVTDDEESLAGEDETEAPVKKRTRTRARVKRTVPTPEPDEDTAKPKPKKKKAVEAEGDEDEDALPKTEKEVDEDETPKKRKKALEDEEVPKKKKKPTAREEDEVTKKNKKKVGGNSETGESEDELQTKAAKRATPPKKVHLEAPIRPLTEPIRDVPLRLTFIKQCPAPSEAPQQTGLGGVSIPGLTVCFLKNCSQDSYVVYNGFPLTAYFGQRTVSDPKWKVVPEDQESTDLYISYNRVNDDKAEYEDVIEFDAPLLIKDSTIASPELSGEAVEGGTLAKDGEALELAITYNCEFQGLVAVTVTLPIIPHGAISFTFPKQCRGATKFVGVRLPGLRIGLESGDAGVVMNGFTQEQFQPFLVHEASNRKIIYQDSTTFYISHAEGRPVKMLEPTVFSHRGIAIPQLSHNMHVADGRTEAEDLDMIVVGPKEQTFEVTYNCIFGGETAITVSFPLIPKGRVSFSWVKVCGQDEDDFFSGFNEEEISRWNLEEDEASNFGVQDANTWHEWDETRWNPDLEQRSEREGEAATGFVNIGTSSSSLSDIILEGVLSPAYSSSSATSTAESATIGRGTNLATYYISVPYGFQQIGVPIVKTLKGSKGGDIVLPKLTGSAMAGGELQADQSPVLLTVEFNCQTAGVTPVLVSVPLLPPNLGAMSFRVVKICGAFEKKESFAFTATNVLAIMGVMVFLVSLCMALIYKQGKGKDAAKYMRVLQMDITPDKVN